jgi:heme/copper-type cytochrome/quinol oxidase subunit 3
MTAAGFAAPVARSRPKGWWGMVIFAASEATLLGAIAGSYWFLRVNTAVWPPHGIGKPTILEPALLAAGLLATLAPFGLAVRAARRGRRGQAFALVLGATALQTAYLAIQLHLFLDDLSRFQPQGSAYASVYYVMLGADHAHIAIGLLFDAWLLARLARRLTTYRLVALEAIRFYWTVVCFVTVVITITQVSPSL